MNRFSSTTRMWLGAALCAVLIAVGGYWMYTYTAKSGGMPEEGMDMSGTHASAHSESGEHEGMEHVTPCTEFVPDTIKRPVKEFTLVAQTKTIQLASGEKVEVMTYNGTVPGPELRVQVGDRVRVHLKNEMKESTAIHWHGVELPCSQDGVAGITQDAVKQGESYTYEFVAQRAGTFWYHSHQYSAEQAKKGLAGKLIIEPKEKKYDRDYAVMLLKLLDTYYMVDGKEKVQTFAAKPGEMVRVRLINADNFTHNMTVVGAPYQLLSIDGFDLNEPPKIENKLVAIGAGQRMDFLFRMPASGSVQVVSGDTEEKARQLLRMNFGSSEGSAGASAEKIASYPMVDIYAYGKPKVDALSAIKKPTRSYDMTLGDAIVKDENGNPKLVYTINGKSGMDIPHLMVRKGDVVKMTFRNPSKLDHPMHLHGHAFKVLTRNGKPISGSPLYMDNILVRPGETYEIMLKAENPGLWMLHCHNLPHATYGMSTMMNYEGVSTPYRVGGKSGNFPD
ncbi:FtsP/CotA-like multicopper oxidase with cupredoxin domain [Aneurinibacillus soli]|uniref:Copper-containing nitrite reductase n=1 Tax=Aneurinibacillus soli TaxID=1500254 RepID=A0A0U4NLW4_9BACL|nr:multicopper oxidase family protein [Aneurinibacillus soli]PYE61836.1 FtsP/CotA-like multicopper oxidase with cupredoxin domain [Aneurinibacillus soli]BAU29652.1 Multicopper oxidase mco [Aneurinibacillus soli]